MIKTLLKDMIRCPVTGFHLNGINKSVSVDWITGHKIVFIFEYLNNHLLKEINAFCSAKDANGFS